MNLRSGLFLILIVTKACCAVEKFCELRYDRVCVCVCECVVCVCVRGYAWVGGCGMTCGVCVCEL